MAGLSYAPPTPRSPWPPYGPPGGYFTGPPVGPGGERGSGPAIFHPDQPMQPMPSEEDLARIDASRRLLEDKRAADRAHAQALMDASLGRSYYTQDRAHDEQRDDANLYRTQQQDRIDRAQIFGLLTSGGGTAPRVSGGSQASEAASEAAQFARAKDSIGLQTQSALAALRQQLSDRGIPVGSPIEGVGTSEILGGGFEGLSNVSRDQAISRLDRSRAVSDRNYAGDITQRGQDLQRQQAIIGLLASRLRY